MRVIEQVRRRLEAYEVKICSKCRLRETVHVELPMEDREMLSTYEAAKVLGNSHRRVRQLLEENRFEGAIKMSRSWLIPYKSVAAMRDSERKASNARPSTSYDVASMLAEQPTDTANDSFIPDVGEEDVAVSLPPSQPIAVTPAPVAKEKAPVKHRPTKPVAGKAKSKAS
jgi:hypothetical protein